jgi:hypothetical protein
MKIREGGRNKGEKGKDECEGRDRGLGRKGLD